MMDFCLFRKLVGVLFCYGTLWIAAVVSPVEGVPRSRGLRFTVQPKDVVVLPGRTVELECDALYKFTTKTSFSWIFNGSDLIVSNAVSQDTFSYNLSQNNGDLRIENISGTAYGVYQCVAKYSGLAIISRPARVRKPYLYKTSEQPSTNIVCNETYPCVLRPPNLLSYPKPKSSEWEFRRNGNETFAEIDKSHERSLVSLEGHLCILSVNESDQGHYRFRTTNIAGSVYEVYNVTVERSNMSSEHSNSRPNLSILVKPNNITAVASSSASFDCIPSEKNTQIYWYKGYEEKSIESNEKYNISLPYRLTVNDVSADDLGWYTCLVFNNFTNISWYAILDLEGALKLNTNWSEHQEILRGGVLMLMATVYYGTMQWYWNGVSIHYYSQNGSTPNGFSITKKITKIENEIVEEQTLRLENMTLYNSGIYQVLASGFDDQFDSKHSEVRSYDCGDTLTALSGSFSTPNFPSPYPENIKCVWLIIPRDKPSHHTLFLEIDHFDVGKGRCKDRLHINDGTTSVSSTAKSFPPGTPSRFTSHFYAFRLVFESGSCGGKHRGFNASYWISDPTTLPSVVPTTKVTEPFLSTEHEYTTQLQRTTKTSTAGKTTKKEGSDGETSSESISGVVYGVAAFLFCVVALVIVLLLIGRRQGNIMLSCIKGNDTNRKQGTERQGHELNEYASSCNIIVYDTPNVKDSELSTSDAPEGPVYAVLEGPGDSENCQESPDPQSTNIYATVNDGCVTEGATPTCTPPRNFDVSFLEEIYTTLTADRANEDVNIYEHLRPENAGKNEQPCDGWSVEGMESTDQDYVSVVS